MLARSLVLPVSVFILGLHSLGAQTWTQVATTGPAPRQSHAMAFDTGRSRTVLFGGATNVSPWLWSDTWEWDGAVWTQTSPAVSPPARQFPVMVYDSQRGRTVMFGGNGSGVAFGDTWEWDGTVWTLVATIGPPARFEHAMAFDSQRGRVVLFGGRDGSGTISGEQGDTWEWDGTTWTQAATTGPAARKSHSMAYDSQRGRTVMFGGGMYNGFGVFLLLRDTWVWDGSSWILMTAEGPAGRTATAMAFESQYGRIALFGGNGNSGPLGDLWEWDGSTWTQVVIAAPSSRSGHSIVYDSQRRRTVLFGGEGISGSGALGDTWEWNRATSIAIARVFGAGCGSPALTATPVSRPLIGQTMITEVHNIPSTYPYTTFAAMAIGFSNNSVGALLLPLALDSYGMPGCYLYHDISVDLAAICARWYSGFDTNTLLIPPNNALLGVVLYLQAWSGTNQNAGGLVTSNAIELTIGNQ